MIRRTTKTDEIRTGVSFDAASTGDEREGLARSVLNHRYAGACPDEVNGWGSRDSECEACAALDALASALSPESNAEPTCEHDAEPRAGGVAEEQEWETERRTNWGSGRVFERKVTPWAPVNQGDE